MAEDYYYLRELGLRYIEELGSASWTDYNAHDPGITLLEALCYALSELGYRTNFDIADILTEENGVISFKQAFFTARRILANCPLTPDDFRKVLIDLDDVRNGWLVRKDCSCELLLFAECTNSSLFFAPLWRTLSAPASKHEHPVVIKGFYDVFLQLEEDPRLGDLNNAKVLHTVNYKLPGAGKVVPVTVEARFPDWQTVDHELYGLLKSPDAKLDSVLITRFSRDAVLDEPLVQPAPAPDPTPNTAFVQGWRNNFFADYQLTFRASNPPSLKKVNLAAVPIRFFSRNDSVRNEVKVRALIEEVLQDASQGGIVAKYHEKMRKVAKAVENARARLHQNRNLCEDFCRIQAVRITDVAVCMDVELSAEADIEWVFANIYNEIELYFNPPIRFYTLKELAAEGQTTDEIFDGPPLENGFIKAEELRAAELRSVIHTSDLYNRLMDIPGVLAVKDLLLTRYDDKGKPVSASERWRMEIPAGHLPKLYLESSRILFYKNNLPFLPRPDEASAILAQLRGGRDRPKIPITEKDYPVPQGKFLDLAQYEPVQHTLPGIYGIGPEGLADSASSLRKAQAKQLKAYLMPFEQLIADMFQQLAHANELFSTDESQDKTYFNQYFDPTALRPAIAGLADLNTTPVLSAEQLHDLTEPKEIFYDRRNRFLDHILARFCEQFRDYALLLHDNSARIPFAPDKLILDKIRFLRFYPRASAARAKAFNYMDAERSCDYRNQSGISERISRLLGMETMKSYFTVTMTANNGKYEATFTLKNESSSPLLRQAESQSADTAEMAEEAAWLVIGDIIANSTNPAAYSSDSDGNDVLQNESGEKIAILETGTPVKHVTDFATAILEKERLYIVEHLLLRPKFPGDALLPVCLNSDCILCGEEDPYSFRLTYVFQGELEPFSLDIDLRRFADNTVRKETPAHLLPKICWVGNQGYNEDPCDPVYTKIADLLEKAGWDPATACNCAAEIYPIFADKFKLWFKGHELELHATSKWQDFVKEEFKPIEKSEIPCLASLEDSSWKDINTLLEDHFTYIAVHGWEFERFEKAWCVWLKTNAGFDWAALNDQLHRRTEQLLLPFFEQNKDKKAACHCTSLLLGYFGNRFRTWIDQLVDAGTDLFKLPADELRLKVWEGFPTELEKLQKNDADFCFLTKLFTNPIFVEELKNILLSTYAQWIEVSFRLNLLLRLFSNLSSIYPKATLHDCDDGSDDNPVRLDNTILGNL